MIILSILVFIMGILCLALLIMAKVFNDRLIEIQTRMNLWTNAWNDAVTSMKDFESKAWINIHGHRKELQDIKESMVGYEFALKTFEDYMKVKLEDKP
jgi:hypothetical protein